MRPSPSGLLGNSKEYFANTSWAVIGAVNPEDRWSAVFEELSSVGATFEKYILAIRPVASKHRFSSEYASALDRQIAEMNAGYEVFQELSLLASTADVRSVFLDLFERCGDSVILDISVLPKRFFFPALKLLRGVSHKFRNIVVTYSGALSYSENELGVHVSDVAPLPLFAPRSSDANEERCIVISVGYMPYSLPEFIKTSVKGDVCLLFPFPPGPPHYLRCNEFVRILSSEVNDMKRICVGAYDIVSQLDFYMSVSNGGSVRLCFAPYGPKPMSISMALFAIEYGSEVVYSQPQAYNPEYSAGTGSYLGQPSVHAVYLKVAGKPLFFDW